MSSWPMRLFPFIVNFIHFILFLPLKDFHLLLWLLWVSHKASETSVHTVWAKCFERNFTTKYTVYKMLTNSYVEEESNGAAMRTGRILPQLELQETNRTGIKRWDGVADSLSVCIDNCDEYVCAVLTVSYVHTHMFKYYHHYGDFVLTSIN